MEWYEYELQRLQETQSFLKKITLGIAIFGSVVIDWFAVYFTQYSLDMMEWHPYPERMIIMIALFVGSAMVVNGLTVMMYLSLRKESINER